MLIVFQQKYDEPESQVRVKHKWYKFAFDPNAKSLSEFLEELNERADRAYGDNTQHTIDNLLYATLPPHLKRSLKLAYLEGSLCDHTVAYLTTDLEPSEMEIDGKLSISTMIALPSNDSSQNTEPPKIVFHYCKNLATSLEIGDCRKQ